MTTKRRKRVPLTRWEVWLILDIDETSKDHTILDPSMGLRVNHDERRRARNLVRHGLIAIVDLHAQLTVHGREVAKLLRELKP